MKTKSVLVAAIGFLFLISCKSEPTLQKYFVASAEDKNFISLDIAPSILNLDKTILSTEEKAALNSFSKLNVLAFKADSTNVELYKSEVEKVSAIMKNPEYQVLMKVGSGKDQGVISYLGEDNHIDEFVLYGNKKDMGFVIVRVLGKDMDPSNIMSVISMMQKSNVDMEQLKPLMEAFKK
jgi:hypothetical protein